LAYDSDVFSFTHDRTTLRVDQSPHQLGKLQKIDDPESRAARADGDLQIRCHDIRPLRRHRADRLLADAQQEPRAVTVVPLADANEFPPAERMERMRHTHKTRRRVGKACILC